MAPTDAIELGVDAAWFLLSMFLSSSPVFCRRLDNMKDVPKIQNLLTPKALTQQLEVLPQQVLTSTSFLPCRAVQTFSASDGFETPGVAWPGMRNCVRAQPSQL